MNPIADDVLQLPLIPRNGINAYLLGDVLVDTGAAQSAGKLADPQENRRSEGRLAGLRPETVGFGHGPVLQDDAAGKLQRFVA